MTDSSLSLPPFLCLQKEKRKLFFLAFSSLSLSLSSALQVLSLSLISFFCFFFSCDYRMGCSSMISGNLDPERKSSGGLRTKQAGRGSCRGS